MYFNFSVTPMFRILFVKNTFLYFIFAVYLHILCHTVVNTSELSVSYQNETLSKENEIEQVKREDRIEVANKSKDTNIHENKVVSPVLNNNETIHNKPLPVEDEFNSTVNLPPWLYPNEGALQRTGYVALGFMSIVLIFFVVRAVRLRQKRSKSRKYGIITSTASDMEMEPLDKDDDEEEDATLFDAQHKYSLQ